MTTLAHERDALAELLAKEGRALAVSLPDEAVAATREFQAVMADTGLDGQVFVAHKATDRTSLVQQLVHETGVGVDVASLGELEACLGHGITPEAMIVTGPKSDALLARAVQCGVRAIVIDSLGELERLIALKADTYPDVLLRLTRSVVNRPGITRMSRFGLDQAAYEAALELLVEIPAIRLRGLAFHIDTKSIDEKVYATSRALDLLGELSERGFDDATVLDIGGGFGHSYGLTPEQLSAFDTGFKATLQRGALNTYQSTTYGLKKLPDGQIVGDYATIDTPVFPVGAERLRTIFTIPYDGTTLSRRAQELLVEVWCEPGSALFSSAGMVVGEIIDVSERDGRMAVVANIQHGQVLFDRNEVLVDPIHLPATKQSGADECSGYLFGQLCMESDVLSYRPVVFGQPPRAGDILIWLHTGAYRMHMSQTNAIMHPDMARYRYENNTFTKEEP